MSKLSLSEEYNLLLYNNNISQKIDTIWAYPNSTHNVIENYGWKIHISALLTNAVDLAKKFLNLNKTRKWDFKIVSSISYLEKINMGYYGNSQVGKFITVYPNPSDVVNILEILYYEFHNDVGIQVGSDYSYKLSSCIYYRFGTLLKDVKQIDNRDKTLKPFGNVVNIPDYTLKHYHKLPSRYLVLKRLKQLGPTGVFLGLDIQIKKKIVIRYSSKFYNLELCNVDENDRLLSSSWLLNKKDILFEPGFETILDTFYVDNSVFMVTEYIEGKTFDELASKNILTQFTRNEKIEIFNQLLYLVNKLNDMEITFRDLSFSNILLTKSNKIKLIDFNYAVSDSGLSSFAGVSLTPAGTYGFYDPEIQESMKFSDRYSLAKFLYFLIYPEKYIEFINQIDVNKSYFEIKSILKKVTVQKLPSGYYEIYNKLVNGERVERVVLS